MFLFALLYYVYLPSFSVFLPDLFYPSTSCHLLYFSNDILVKRETVFMVFILLMHL